MPIQTGLQFHAILTFDPCHELRLHHVASIFSSSKAFAALKKDGTVVTWGKAGSGTQLQENRSIKWKKHETTSDKLLKDRCY